MVENRGKEDAVALIDYRQIAQSMILLGYTTESKYKIISKEMSLWYKSSFVKKSLEKRCIYYDQNILKNYNQLLAVQIIDFKIGDQANDAKAIWNDMVTSSRNIVDSVRKAWTNMMDILNEGRSLDDFVLSDVSDITRTKTSQIGQGNKKTCINIYITIFYLDFSNDPDEEPDPLASRARTTLLLRRSIIEEKRLIT